MGKRSIKQKLFRIAMAAGEKWKNLKSKEKVMLAGAGVFLLLGVCVLLAPKSAKHQRLREQEELISIVLSGDESLEIKTDSAQEAMIFYESGEDEMDYFGDSPSQRTQVAALESPESDEPKKTEIIGLGVLEIDKIDLRLPVAEGATKTSLKIAAGHVSETAAIGQEGNAVVAAHRSYTKGEYFNRLDELAVGDSVGYTAKDGRVYHFKVIDVQTLEPSDISVFDIRTGESDLTLYTCTPVRVASHRLAVRCTLVESMTKG